MQAFQSVTGAAAPLLQDDVNTDQIIPSMYLRRLEGNLAAGLFAYMRRKSDGTTNEQFVLEQPQFRSAPILVVGANFGCGSSREHAAWAMRDFGIRCIIGYSHAEYFRENCLKNGMLAISLAPRVMDTFVYAVTEADGHDEFTVDLVSQSISAIKSGQTWSFEISPFEKMALLEGLDEIGLTAKHLDAIADWEARTARAMPFLQKLSLARKD